MTPQQMEVWPRPIGDFPRPERFGLRQRLVSWRNPGDPGRAAPVPGQLRSVFSNCCGNLLHRQAWPCWPGCGALPQARGEFLFSPMSYADRAYPKRACSVTRCSTRCLMRRPLLERLQQLATAVPAFPDPRPGEATGRWRSPNPDLSARTGPIALFSATTAACRQSRARRSLRRHGQARDLPGRNRRPPSSSFPSTSTPHRGGPGFPVCGNTVPESGRSRTSPLPSSIRQLRISPLRPFTRLRWRPSFDLARAGSV